MKMTLTLLLCGLATFLLRWIPIHQALTGTARRLPPLVARTLNAIGPAAIMALLVVSLVPLLRTHAPTDPHTWGVPVALATIWIAKRWRGGIALPTLLGAVIYGFCSYLSGQ